MSKIIKIGITELNNKEIVEVNTIDLVAGKGIIAATDILKIIMILITTYPL